MTASHIYVTRRKDHSADITISNLTLNRPDNGEALVKDLNLTLKPGDRLLLSGASGSGKSTLIRAIRDVWDAGEGEIKLPATARIITASQKAYAPTTSLKGVLSYPAAEKEFYDVQVERALRAVGLDRLVQFLPDRQPLYIINQILGQIPSMLESMEQPLSQQEKIEKLADSLLQTIPGLVKDNLDIVHHLSYQNERDLRAGLLERLDTAFGHSIQRNQIEYLATRISDSLNKTMAQKLVNVLVADIPQLISRDLGKITHIDMNRMNFYVEKTTRTMQKKLDSALEKAHVNPLGAFQKAYITEQIKLAIENELSPRLTWNYTFNKVGAAIDGIHDYAQKLPQKLAGFFTSLTSDQTAVKTNTAFNKASLLRSRDWLLMDKETVPLRLTALFLNAASRNIDRAIHLLRAPMLNKSAKKSSEYLIGKAARYLAGQTVNGDILSKRLSGGEQQRLIFARAFMHQPDILILDEVTAALDKDAGLELYDEIVSKLPETIIISVAHNMHILEHHTLHGHLQEREIKVTPVHPKPAQP